MRPRTKNKWIYALYNEVNTNVKHPTFMYALLNMNIHCTYNIMELTTVTVCCQMLDAREKKHETIQSQLNERLQLHMKTLDREWDSGIASCESRRAGRE